MKCKSGLFKATAAALLAIALIISLSAGLIGFTRAEDSEDYINGVEPKVWTDKNDYSPGETVTIYGEGFTPNAAITITIQRPDNSIDTLYAESSSEGEFTVTYQLDGIEGEYMVTAEDRYGKTATTKFTDCAITIDLYGYTLEPNPGWTKGDVKGYLEDQWIPFKIEVKSSKFESCNIVVHLDYYSPSYGYGLDDVRNFTMWRNGVIETPSITGPSPDGWERGIWQLQFSWTFTINKNNNCTLYFEVHVAIGAHRYPGAKIHVHIHDPPGERTIPVQIGSATISGYKWNDKDGDGKKDLNEPKLRDWTINLYRLVDGKWNYIRSDTTDSNGEYSFSVYCAGIYMVNETIKSGWRQTYPGNNSYIIVVSRPCTYANRNFGNKEITKYKLTVYASGLGTRTTNVYNGSIILGTASDSQPYVGWFDEGSVIYLNIDSPITDGSTRFVFTYWSGDASGTNRPITIIMNSDKTIIANYKTQYLVSFTQTGSGVAPTVNYQIDTGPSVTDTVPFSIWVDSGKQISYTYQDIVPGGSGVRYVLTGVSPTSPQTVTSPLTITGTYKTQYQVTFAQTGLDDTATGVVVTIDGVGKTRNDLPLTDWFDSGTTYSYSSLVSSTIADKRFRLDSVTGPTSPITSPGTVTGNYIPQYKVTFIQSGLDDTASGTVVTVSGAPKTYGELPFKTDWLDHGSSITFEYSNIVDSSVSGKQFKLVSVSHTSPLMVIAPTTIVGTYKIQYLITFDQTGLDDTAFGTVLTVNETSLTFNGLPYEEWFDEGDILEFSYHNVSSTVNGKRFILVSVNASSPLEVTGPTTIIGNYKTQYRLIVSISPPNLGIGNITINPTGDDKAGNGNWISYWYDSCTTVSLMASPRIYVSGYEYYPFVRWSWDSQTSSSTSISIHMDSPKSVTAEYGILSAEIYTVTFKVLGVGKSYKGVVLAVIIDFPNGTRLSYGFTVANMSSAVFYLPRGANVTFTWNTPLPDGSKQYVWMKTIGLPPLQQGNQRSGTFTVNSDATITGYYSTQKAPRIPPAGTCKTKKK